MNDELEPDNQPDAEDKKRNTPAWVGGVVLIIIGVAFLFQNISGLWLSNWWALFILIPAIGSLATAWRIYESHGHMTASARGPLVGGIVLLMVTATFLFNLDWGRVWPVFLIIAGASALAAGLLSD
jgi:hypothetical protein